MDLPTSLTGIGVKGVKVLPIEANKNKHNKPCKTKIKRSFEKISK